MIVFISLLGLAVGSFLNVLVDRLPRSKSIVKERSHCDKCKKTLKWYDLIPLFSFIILKGKCHYCSTPLSFYYPVVELTTGILFVVVLFFVGSINVINFINFIFYLFLIGSLIVVFFADLKYGIIPDKIIFPAIAVSFLYFLINHSPASPTGGSLIINHLFSAVGASLFFLLLFLITKGKGMGFGDVKFAFLMGLILGFPNIIVGLYVAFLTGAIIGCILILWRKKRVFGTAIPFGPFLVIGTLVSIFLGNFLFQNFLHIMALR